MAKLDYKNEKLLAELCYEARRKIRDFNSQNIANTLWAMANLDYRNEKVLIELYYEAQFKICDFNGQDITNTLWAMAKLDYRHEKLLFELCHQAQRKIRDFNSQEIANTLWAMATLDYRDQKLLLELCHKVGRKICDFNSQNISNTLWAMATLDYRNEKLLLELCHEVQYKIRKFNSQNISNTLWAIAVLDHYDADLNHHLLSTSYSFSIIQLSQIQQYNLYFDESIKVDFTPISVDGISSSKLHIDISNVLHDIGIKHENEIEVLKSVVVDIYIPKSKNIIEVNGPSHYLSDGTLNGESKFKVRLLEKYGYNVIIIPYWEWDKSEKICYLRNVLNL
jgi:RAP domain-containing protein/uncharacterized protein DUF1601